MDNILDNAFIADDDMMKIINDAVNEMNEYKKEIKEK